MCNKAEELQIPFDLKDNYGILYLILFCTATLDSDIKNIVVQYALAIF